MAEAVTAASTALPPWRSTSTAARVASGDEVAAMPLVPRASERPGWSKFLIPHILFHWRQKLPQNCRKQHRIVAIYIARKPASCSCRSLAILPTDGLFNRNVLFPGMNDIFS